MGRDRRLRKASRGKSGGNEVAVDPSARARGRRRIAILMGLLTAVLLSASFAPHDGWFLAYVALVPWVLGLTLPPSRKWALFCGWFAGLIFWAGNLYWLWWITLVGYAAMVLYLSVYWLVAAAVIRASLRRNYPMWIVLPLVWVALEYARAYVISGFPWFFLGHSQYSRISLIQVADLTGQYGVSFFVAMVNGAIVDVVRAWRRGKTAPTRTIARIATGVGVTVLIGLAMILYGLLWRLREQTTAPGPVIGLVQGAFPTSLSGRGASPEKILTEHLQSSHKFIGKNCDLVVWGETVLPAGLNAEMLELDPGSLGSVDLRSLSRRMFGTEADSYSDESLRGALGRAIGLQTTQPSGFDMRSAALRVGDLSQRLKCPILAGSTTIHRNLDPINDDDRYVMRNSALWFDQEKRPSRIYSKNHLVPFGEYVPFKKSFLVLHRALRWFVPPVMAQLDPGRSRAPFELRSGPRTYRLVAPICYEGTFARLCRRMIVRDGKKQADILVNISNDGWFVHKYRGGSYRGTTEQAQHLVQYCFRAVENRVPVVRAVNTGISASIDSCGRIVSEVGLELEGYTKRTMVTGTLLLNGAEQNTAQYGTQYGPQILVDSRITVYSLIGDVFAITVSAAGIVLVGQLVRRRKEKSSEEFPMQNREEQ